MAVFVFHNAAMNKKRLFFSHLSDVWHPIALLPVSWCLYIQEIWHIFQPQ